MIHEVVKFVHELFPSISPYTAEQVKSSLRQFERSGQKYDYFMPKSLQYLAQGDIIEELVFTKTSPTGDISFLKTKAILLSNT